MRRRNVRSWRWRRGREEKSGGYRRDGGRRKREKRNKEISLGVACYYEGGGGKRRRSLCRGCLVGSSEAPTRCLTAFVWYFINTSANYFPFFLPDARPGLAQQKESGMRPYTSSPVPRCSLFLSLCLSNISRVTEIPHANVCTHSTSHAHPPRVKADTLDRVFESAGKKGPVEPKWRANLRVASSVNAQVASRCRVCTHSVQTGYIVSSG